MLWGSGFGGGPTFSVGYFQNLAYSGWFLHIAYSSFNGGAPYPKIPVTVKEMTVIPLVK